MPKCYEAFIEYLKKDGVNMEEETFLEEDEKTNLVSFPKLIKNKYVATISVMFDKEDRFVDVYLTGTKVIEESELLAKAYMVTNELNREYRGATFYINEKEVCSKASFFIKDNFSLYILLNTINNVIDAVETEWEKFYSMN